MFDLSRLTDETFIKRVEFLPVIDSTNNFALELATRSDLELPLLVLAGEQTAGRGRGQNTWWSDEGSLTWTLLLDAEELQLSPENWPQVSLAAALAVCEMLEEFWPEGARQCGIKWPNDVHAAGKKICGILPELPQSVSHGRPLPKRLVLGVGININNSVAAAPAELHSIATTLKDLTGREHDLTEVLLAIFRRLPHHLKALATHDLDLADAWAQRCVLRGKSIEVTIGDRILAGECHGIAPDGGILIHDGEDLKTNYSGIVTKVGF